MRKTSNVHRVFGNGCQVTAQARILGAQQVLNPGVLHKSPEVANQARLRIPRKHIAQSPGFIRHSSPITLRKVLNQVLQPDNRQLECAEFQMSGLMRRHDHIETHVFIVGRIPPDEGRQADALPVFTHRGTSHRLGRFERVGEIVNAHIATTERLREQFDAPGDLPQRHAAHGLRHGAQGLLRFHREVGPPPLQAVLQHFHAGSKPGLELLLRSLTGSDQGDQFRAASKIGQRRLSVTLGDQQPVTEHLSPPFLRKKTAEHRRRLRQYRNTRCRRTLGHLRSDADHLIAV